jgi:hypothetical protein
MIRSKFVRSLTLAVFASAALACGESTPTGPSAPLTTDNSLLGGLVGGLLQTVTGVVGFVADATGLTVHPVRWSSTHPAVAYSTTETITQWGGVMTIPETDLTVVFPFGAVSQPTQITITADPNFVAYKMEPHGIRFSRPVVATQRLRNTAVAGQSLSGHLFGAYISDDLLDLSSLLHALEIENSLTIFGSGSARIPDSESWTVNHFSRYMLASD